MEHKGPSTTLAADHPWAIEYFFERQPTSDSKSSKRQVVQKLESKAAQVKPRTIDAFFARSTGSASNKRRRFQPAASSQGRDNPALLARAFVFANANLLAHILCFVGGLDMLIDKTLCVDRIFAQTFRGETRLWQNLVFNNNCPRRATRYVPPILIKALRRYAAHVRSVTVVAIDLRFDAVGEQHLIDLLLYVAPPHLHSLSLINCSGLRATEHRLDLFRGLSQLRIDESQQFADAGGSERFLQNNPGCRVVLNGSHTGQCSECHRTTVVRTCDWCKTASVVNGSACHERQDTSSPLCQLVPAAAAAADTLPKRHTRSYLVFHDADFVTTCLSCGTSLCASCFQKFTCRVWRKQNPRDVPGVALCHECNPATSSDREHGGCFGRALVEMSGAWEQQCPCVACGAYVCAGHLVECGLCNKEACSLCQDSLEPSAKWPIEQRTVFAWWCTECQTMALLHSDTSIADLIARMSLDQIEQNEGYDEGFLASRNTCVAISKTGPRYVNDKCHPGCPG